MASSGAHRGGHCDRVWCTWLRLRTHVSLLPVAQLAVLCVHASSGFAVPYDLLAEYLAVEQRGKFLMVCISPRGQALLCNAYTHLPSLLCCTTARCSKSFGPLAPSVLLEVRATHPTALYSPSLHEPRPTLLSHCYHTTSGLGDPAFAGLALVDGTSFGSCSCLPGPVLYDARVGCVAGHSRPCR